MLTVFPGSERLRYLIPFAEPHETIDYLRERRRAAPGRGGRLRRRRREVRHLARTRRSMSTTTAGWSGSSTPWSTTSDWLQVTTPSEAIDNVPPLGKIYLPEGSYREMTEWALPAEQQIEYERVAPRDAGRPALGRDRAVRPRRLLAELQGRSIPNRTRCTPGCMMVSRRLQRRRSTAATDGELIDAGPARALSRPVQLQLLARRVRRHLSAASPQRRLPAPDRRRQPARSSSKARLATGDDRGSRLDADDFNFDARPEIRLANDRLVALWLARRRAGSSTNSTSQSICHNLLATLDPPSRSLSPQGAGRPDRRAATGSPASTTGGLQAGGARPAAAIRHLSRKSLVDHFYSVHVDRGDVAGWQCRGAGRLLSTAPTRRNSAAARARATATASARDMSAATRRRSPRASRSTPARFHARDRLPARGPARADSDSIFAPELNFAGLPGGADDRYFHDRRAATAWAIWAAQLDLPTSTRPRPGRPVARHRCRLRRSIAPPRSGPSRSKPSA